MLGPRTLSVLLPYGIVLLSNGMHYTHEYTSVSNGHSCYITNYADLPECLRLRCRARITARSPQSKPTTRVLIRANVRTVQIAVSVVTFVGDTDACWLMSIALGNTIAVRYSVIFIRWRYVRHERAAAAFAITATTAVVTGIGKLAARAVVSIERAFRSRAC